MSTPTFGAQPGVAGNFPSTQQLIFETEFRRRLRDLSVVDKITSKTWKGRFRNTGVQIRIPCLPLVETHRRRPGDPVRYQELKGSEEVFTINRERDVAFHVQVEDSLFAPQNLESAVNKEARAQFAEDRDVEFFNDIYAKCHECNCGNEAGVRHGDYDVGAATAPVWLYKTDGDANASDKEHKCSATEFVANLAAMIKEWPGGKTGSLTVLVPTCIQNRLINSELKYADRMGDQMSVLRKGVDYVGEIAGATVLGCNQLPWWKADEGEGLPKRFLCLVVNSEAIEYVDEVVIDENIKDKDQYGNFYRTLGIYDWFARYPELFGYGVCAIG